MPLRVSRREFLRLSALAGASSALAACIPATPTQANTTQTENSRRGTPAPVDLRFVWWGGQARADLTSKVIRMFEAKYPHIHIVYEFLSFNDYWTKMTTQAAGGGLPDIMQTGSGQLVDWVDKGLNVPLDDYIKEGIIDFTHIPRVLQNHGAVNGRICALSNGSNAIGFAADLDAFAKAGIAVPPDTWTWDDFEKIVLQLRAKLGIWGFGDYLHHWDIWGTILRGWDMDLYAANGKALGYSNDQPGIDHMKMILRLQDAKAEPTLGEETEVKSPETAFSVTRRAAIDWLAGSNMLVAMWAAGGPDRNYKILPIPRSRGKKQGTTIRPSQFLALTAHSKHPKEAATFIDYFINDVEANKVLNAERGVPINSVVLDALAASAGPAQKAIYDYLARLAKDSAELGPLDPAGADIVRTNVYYPEFTDPVRYKKITPEEGVATFRKKANETLAKGN